jgi:hypothetical protein
MSWDLLIKVQAKYLPIHARQADNGWRIDWKVNLSPEKKMEYADFTHMSYPGT